MRAFIAVPPDPQWQAAIARQLGPLRKDLPQASWTRPESWHLTLKFLGDVAERFPGQVGGELSAAAHRTPRRLLEFRAPEFFPSPRRPRVLALALAADEPLAVLARMIDEIASRSGVPPETRAFRPHLTLARCRSPWGEEAVEAFATAVSGWTLPDWPVDRIVLYRSELHPEGARYAALADFVLG